MPNRDGTGPSGDGRPGRGLGNCGKVRSTGSRLTNANEARSLVDIGADFLTYLIRNIISKKNDTKRS